jgi:hypothetical protein
MPAFIALSSLQSIHQQKAAKGAKNGLIVAFRSRESVLFLVMVSF